MGKETLAIFDKKGGLKTILVSGMMNSKNLSLIGLESNVNHMAIKSFLELISCILTLKGVNSTDTSNSTKNVSY